MKPKNTSVDKGYTMGQHMKNYVVDDFKRRLIHFMYKVISLKIIENRREREDRIVEWVSRHSYSSSIMFDLDYFENANIHCIRYYKNQGKINKCLYEAIKTYPGISGYEKIICNEELRERIVGIEDVFDDLSIFDKELFYSKIKNFVSESCYIIFEGEIERRKEFLI